MSFENAKENLARLGKELKLPGGLCFDEFKTAILCIDNTFSLHVTYEENSDRLFLYAPIADALPADEKIRLALYEVLLQGAILGGQMVGGGVGVAVDEQLILLHITIDMGLGASPDTLSQMAPVFVENVELWRSRVSIVVAGGHVDVSIQSLVSGQGERVSGNISDSRRKAAGSRGSAMKA